MRDFPKMLYRADGAKLVERIVADEAAMIIAQGEGFGDYAAAKVAARAAAAKPAVAATASGKAAAPAPTVIVDDAKVKRLEAALSAAESSATAERAAAEAARELADAAGTRIVELETFLGELRDDEGAPEELRNAISKLLGDGAEGEAAPAEAPAKKATRKKAASAAS